MNKLFIYAGHTLKANILGDAQLVVESLKAKPTQYGIYPTNFAEGETWDILAESMEAVNCDSVEEANEALQLKIVELINIGIFAEA